MILLRSRSTSSPVVPLAPTFKFCTVAVKELVAGLSSQTPCGGTPTQLPNVSAPVEVFWNVSSGVAKFSVRVYVPGETRVVLTNAFSVCNWVNSNCGGFARFTSWILPRCSIALVIVTSRESTLVTDGAASRNDRLTALLPTGGATLELPPPPHPATSAKPERTTVAKKRFTCM